MFLLITLRVLAPAPNDAPLLELHTQVRGSIERSLRRVQPKHGAALAAQTARLLRWRGDVVRDVHPGDRLSLLFEAHTPAVLVALRYEGATVKLEAYRFVAPDGRPRYYDRDGVRVAPRLRNSPVPAYGQITEKVQTGPGKRRHLGIDLKAPEGTPVVAPFPGVVTRVNWSTRHNGNCVEIRFDPGMTGLFLHLAEVAPALAPGQVLAAGAPVGTVGNTGRSTAPHLHYELRRTATGTLLDPLETHGHDPDVLEGQAVLDFEQRVAHHRPRLLGEAPLRN